MRPQTKLSTQIMMHQSVVVLALLMAAFVAISAEEFTFRRGARRAVKGLLRGEEKSIEHVRERRLKASKSKKKMSATPNPTNSPAPTTPKPTPEPTESPAPTASLCQYPWCCPPYQCPEYCQPGYCPCVDDPTTDECAEIRRVNNGNGPCAPALVGIGGGCSFGNCSSTAACQQSGGR